VKFNDLNDHLFNLKVLATLDFQKIGITEYLRSIKESKMLVTESKLKAQETNLGYKQIQQIIHKSGEVSLDTLYDETTTKITSLLKDIEIEEPLFGGVRIELKNILETIKKSKDLREFIFGYPVIFQSGNFSKEPFNKQFKDIKTEGEILSYYIELKNFQFESSFISYLKLLESIEISLKTSLDNLKKELEKTLKGKNQEQKRTHIRALNKQNKIKLEQSPYLVVTDVINYDYNNDIDLANFLYTFSKTNSIESRTLIDLKPFLIILFFDAYIEQNHGGYIENVLVEKEEIFAILQKRNNLSEIVLPTNIHRFEEIEKGLIREDYFDSSAKWNEANKKTKKILVEFILHCHLQNYFKVRANVTDTTELKKLRVFFEHRYANTITNQFKPNQRNLIQLPSHEFRWIEKAL
jgi:hypothetical protein